MNTLYSPLCLEAVKALVVSPNLNNASTQLERYNEASTAVEMAIIKNPLKEEHDLPSNHVTEDDDQQKDASVETWAKDDRSGQLMQSPQTLLRMPLMEMKKGLKNLLPLKIREEGSFDIKFINSLRDVILEKMLGRED